jgi:hypothetical protein
VQHESIPQQESSAGRTCPVKEEDADVNVCVRSGGTLLFVRRSNIETRRFKP